MLLAFWVFGFISPSIDDHDYKESSATFILNVLLFYLFGPVLIGMRMCVGDFDFFYVESSVRNFNTCSFATNSNL
jgi:hypothetical protein